MATNSTDTTGEDTEVTTESFDRAWWKEAVVYQIYPWSFNDSDGDGVGDIQGIIEKLDYLDDLGVDVVWLNPVYESPQIDNGYDIADYQAIHEEFGTIEDWEALLEGLHARDMKLIMDLVVNHTSSAHEWFVESRANPDGEYGDYYIWVDGDPDEYPNNWESFFGGPAWTYDEQREAWYLHLFHSEQPDLNWENPDLREDVYEMMNWWLEKGIDGFRLDVINLISKPDDLPDGDPDSDLWTGGGHYINGPNIFKHLGEMHDRTFSNYDTMTVGEMATVDVAEARDYTGVNGPLDMVFNFDHLRLDFGPEGRWDVGEWSLVELKETLGEWQTGLLSEGWPSVFFENHDQPRSVSRFCEDDRYHREAATLLATVLLTLRGTPYIYQGEELGMTNTSFESLSEVRDVDTIQNVREEMDRRGIETYEEFRDVVEYRSRDNARTPMQWDASEHAGFTDGEPWMPTNDNYEQLNVEEERTDPDSVWHYYRELIDLRHERNVLVYGDYKDQLPDDEAVWAYTRWSGEENLLVVCNFAAEPIQRPNPVDATGTLITSNYDDAPVDLGPLELRPYEARVYDLQ
ncbi:alpha-glucosidase [Halorarius litoreus]|uniref:alpha-glucosidase n=1 Tax=Halorarius litoreus TaxID=2962676 RepID=UPI0020CC828B|nr:alpha-glucosidase [Halorarius litoreus]